MIRYVVSLAESSNNSNREINGIHTQVGIQNYACCEMPILYIWCGYSSTLVPSALTACQAHTQRRKASDEYLYNEMFANDLLCNRVVFRLYTCYHIRWIGFLVSNKSITSKLLCLHLYSAGFRLLFLPFLINSFQSQTVKMIECMSYESEMWFGRVQVKSTRSCGKQLFNAFALSCSRSRSIVTRKWNWKIRYDLAIQMKSKSHFGQYIQYGLCVCMCGHHQHFECCADMLWVFKVESITP